MSLLLHLLSRSILSTLGNSLSGYVIARTRIAKSLDGLQRERMARSSSKATSRFRHLRGLGSSSKRTQSTWSRGLGPTKLLHRSHYQEDVARGHSSRISTTLFPRYCTDVYPVFAELPANHRLWRSIRLNTRVHGNHRSAYTEVVEAIQHDGSPICRACDAGGRINALSC